MGQGTDPSSPCRLEGAGLQPLQGSSLLPVAMKIVYNNLCIIHVPRLSPATLIIA